MSLRLAPASATPIGMPLASTATDHLRPSLALSTERRRLQVLLTLTERPNVLLLDEPTNRRTDEPTNGLDLDTLRALEDFLDDWPGIVITVSYDRSFLDRVTDTLGHRELSALGDRMTRAQELVDKLDEAWLALAAEAESLGLDL